MRPNRARIFPERAEKSKRSHETVGIKLLCLIIEGSGSVAMKMDPDSGGPKIYGSGSATLAKNLQHKLNHMSRNGKNYFFYSMKNRKIINLNINRTNHCLEGKMGDNIMFLSITNLKML